LIVTGFLYRSLVFVPVPLLPLEHPLATRTVVATSAKTAPDRRLILIRTP
jgi:hypothetical protein